VSAAVQNLDSAYDRPAGTDRSMSQRTMGWVQSLSSVIEKNFRCRTSSPDVRAVKLLLGHTKIESIVRYHGIEVDDALSTAEQIDV
jgi:hypothetical protein